MQFLIPITVSILIMSLAVLFIISEHVNKSLNKENITLVEHASENFELIFNELNSLNLYIMASSREFKDLQSMLNKKILSSEDAKELASLKNFIDSPSIARSYIDSIYIYLPNYQNQFISSTSGGLQNLDSFYDTEWFDSYKSNLRESMDSWTNSRTIQREWFANTNKEIDIISLYQRIPESNGVLVLNLESNYFTKKLEEATIYEGQKIVMLNLLNEQVLSTQKISPFSSSQINDLNKYNRDFFSTTINGESYIVSKKKIGNYYWSLISVIPKSNLYHLSKILIKLTVLLSFISLIISSYIALHFTKKLAVDLQRILSLLDSANRGQSISRINIKVTDIYSFITKSILERLTLHHQVSIELAHRKYKEQEIEFAALHSQLNPHFLYNTLETVKWKAIALTGKPNDVTSMIDYLADILRYSLDDNHRMVQLKEEIHYTKCYIQIQKIRYQKKFDVIWDVDEETNFLSIKKLLLQPIIENTLMHGMDHINTCLIKIRIRNYTNFLQIRIIDNGIGINKIKVDEVNHYFHSNIESNKHIGLLNTYRRLKIAYGNNATMILWSKEHIGTIVTITVPI